MSHYEDLACGDVSFITESLVLEVSVADVLTDHHFSAEASRTQKDTLPRADLSTKWQKWD